uniref:TM2 domain-containing protein n=1 Tax=Macrostomum lignano TaxID=282301 RepID=A0A1I8IQ82_9PLAT
FQRLHHPFAKIILNQIRLYSPAFACLLLFLLLQLTAIPSASASASSSSSAASPTSSATADWPSTSKSSRLSCDQLRPGQYLCSEPDINPATQQAVNCSKEGFAPVLCELADNLTCIGDFLCPTSLSGASQFPNRCFQSTTACRWTNGKQFHVAVLLSVFTGFLGLDRFYLGYPAIGLAKLFTFGGYGFLHLLDVILISLQIVRPADQSHYVSPHYGPLVTRIPASNDTLFTATAEGEQAASVDQRAELRKRFLRALEAAEGRPMTLRFHGCRRPPLQADEFLAADINFTALCVRGLAAPLGKVDKALIRTGDLVSMATLGDTCDKQ